MVSLLCSENGEVNLFKKNYDRGDLPIAVSFHGAVRKVNIKKNLKLPQKVVKELFSKNYLVIFR